MNNIDVLLKSATMEETIPCVPEDWKKLQDIAKKLSSENPERQLTPNEVAALVIHVALKDELF